MKEKHHVPLAVMRIPSNLWNKSNLFWDVLGEMSMFHLRNLGEKFCKILYAI